MCHLFICGLYFMYLYIILKQRIEGFICYKSAQWLNQSCDKKIRGDELIQLHSFASRSCRLQLPSITNTICMRYRNFENLKSNLELHDGKRLAENWMSNNIKSRLNESDVALYVFFAYSTKRLRLVFVCLDTSTTSSSFG